MRNKDDEQLRELINNETIALFQDSRNDLGLKAKSQIFKHQSENKKTYNLRRKPERHYNVGDMVSIKRTQFGGGLKLKPKFLGPYHITKVKQKNDYDVQKVGHSDGPKISSTYAEYLKPWPTHDDNDEHSRRMFDQSGRMWK